MHIYICIYIYIYLLIYAIVNSSCFQYYISLYFTKNSSLCALLLLSPAYRHCLLSNKDDRVERGYASVSSQGCTPAGAFVAIWQQSIYRTKDYATNIDCPVLHLLYITGDAGIVTNTGMAACKEINCNFLVLS